MRTRLLRRFGSSSSSKKQLASFSTNRQGNFDHPIIPLLQSLSNPTDLRILHAHTITSSLIKDPFATSRIIEFCFKCSNTHYAKLIFDSLYNPDVYTWNAMIIGSAPITSQPISSPFSYYFQMLQRGVTPNNQTFAYVIKACSVMFGTGSTSTTVQNPELALVGIGRKMHGQILKHGVDGLLVITNSLINMYCKMGFVMEAQVLFNNSPILDLISWNTMVTAYGRRGAVETARKMFDEMPERSLVSWSAMIDACVISGEFAEALRLFKEMFDDCSCTFRLDAVILVSVLKACANLGALDQGRWVHKYIHKNNLSWDRNVVLGTALVDMYAKCGCIDVALDLFSMMHNKDEALWNAIIGGLATHGHGPAALQLFSTMRQQGTTPNATTFLAVLCACAHSGMVNKGIEIFESMRKDYGIEPRGEHYGCLADILGRAGLVHEAEQILCNMPMEAQTSQWGALMAACRSTNNFEVGERVGKHLISLEPHDGGRYVLLSNIYAVAGRWEDVRKTRIEMHQRGVKKDTACSLIEQNGIVHEFIAGDTAHPQHRDIYEMLEKLERKLKRVGLAEDTCQINDLDKL